MREPHEFAAELADFVRLAAERHGLTIEDAYHTVVNELAEGLATILGVEFCDCAKHVRH